MHRPSLSNRYFGISAFNDMLSMALSRYAWMGSKHQLGPGRRSWFTIHRNLQRRTRYNKAELRRLYAERGSGSVRKIAPNVRASFWPTKRA